jgi:hypothetical protein
MLSNTDNSLLLLGEETRSLDSSESSAPQAARKRVSKKTAPSSNAAESAPESITSPSELSPYLAAFPLLSDPAQVCERAVEILSSVDEDLVTLLPAELPFPPEDDPFTRTAEEWETLWYSTRESALRVYLNTRMEFRRQLALALNGEPHDLKPWTYWVFHGGRPEDGEPVYGLTPERRDEIGWTYPYSKANFRIYRDQSAGETDERRG